MQINYSNINFKAKKMSKAQAEYFNKELKHSKSVDIICHEITDRDAANSALAMYDYLTQQGINARIILSQKVESLTLRKPVEDIIQAENLKNDETADTVLCVDFSAKERIAPNVWEHIKKADKILCMDHHKGANIESKKTKIPQSSRITPIYTDTTAKSATSIIYRFFEALGIELSNETAYDLFFGLLSDCNKKGLLECDGIQGTIKPSIKLIKNKNAYEIYNKLKNKLSRQQISNMVKNIDVMCTLTEKEKAFNASLYKNAKLSESKKIAFVEIPPDDAVWRELGGENTRTSAILNNFRRSVLKSNDEKFKKAEAAVVFYEANGIYKVSFHSKRYPLSLFYSLAQDAIADPSCSIGGHDDRGGGKISTLDKKACHNFAATILECLEYCLNQN